MKTTWITITVFVMVGLFAFTCYKYYKTEEAKKNILPTISTTILPTGIVGQQYEAEVLGGYIGTKSKAKVVAKELPPGINLSDCKTTYNGTNLPKPNSVVKCNLVGNPTQSGDFRVKISLTSEGFDNLKIQNIPLLIIE